MSSFPSDTLYRSQVARNQQLLAEAAAERFAHSARNGSGVYDGATRLVVFALRARPAAGTRRAAVVD